MGKSGTLNPRLIYKRYSSDQGIVYRVGKNGTLVKEGVFSSEAEIESIRRKIQKNPSSLCSDLGKPPKFVLLKPKIAPKRIQEQEINQNQIITEEYDCIAPFEPIDYSNTLEPNIEIDFSDDLHFNLNQVDSPIDLNL